MDEQGNLFSLTTQSGRNALNGFDPARLTQARFAMGLTKTKLAEHVGVSSAAIGQYESHIITPKPEQLLALARVLKVPVDYFAPGRPIGWVDGTQAHFRSLRSTTARERSKALAYIEQVWELTFALEKKVKFPDVNLPRGNYDSPEQAAQVLRRFWNLGTKPVRHLTAVIESHGVVVNLVAKDNEAVTRVDAFSASQLERPVIISTSKSANSVFRHRFTLAHELGHLLLHNEAVSGDKQQEREADQFAAEFLTPRAQMINLLPWLVDFSRLYELSKSWGVSVDSLLFRMKEIGFVSHAAVQRGYKKLNKLRSSGLESEEPVSVYPGEMPSMLIKAATLADEQIGYTQVDLAKDLKWHPARLREILGVEDPRPTLRLIQGG